MASFNVIPRQAVKVMQVSGNKKTGLMSGTWAPIKQTCPNTCPFKEGIVTRDGKKISCYAMVGNAKHSVKQCEEKAEGMSPFQVAKVEALGIDLLDAYGQPLRIHMSGDARTNAAAKTISDAAGRFVKRGGGAPFTYTHVWRKVKRAAWGIVSVLASLHKPSDSKLATKRGYASSIVVDKFPNDAKPFKLEGSDLTWIPCPQQTEKSKNCLQCGLCFKDQNLLKTNRGIAFQKHTPNDKRQKKK